MPNLRIAELDFDQIKQNLKEFLQNQDEFTDYDFEGSGFSILLDILAYNTHYNAYLANMVVNEMFLDSAVKRNSAVSIAKHLGYTPASVRGARAVLNVTVNSPIGSPQTLTLPRFTSFTTTINGTGFTFLNITELTTTPVNNSYTFEGVTVIEGEFKNQAFVSVQPGPDEKFEITETNIDTSTLIVSVQKSSTDTTTTTYTLSNDITGLDETSEVFFLQENPFGRYEIFFGDGIIGKKLEAGNIVNIRYLVPVGSAANVSDLVTQTFITTPIGGSSNITITTVSNSSSGADKESITSIKFKAPLVNAAKNRAVTAEDYKALISANFSDAESISVWGGEENDPPIFGKVFISLKPFDGFVITQATKQNIINSILNPKKVLAIQPEFVDPEYVFINMVVNVEYNSLVTTKTAGQIETIIENAIRNYFSTNLQKFNLDFKKSKVINLISTSDPSIDSVLMLIKLQKRFLLTFNQVNSFLDQNTIKFQNKLSPGTISSSNFFASIGGFTTLVRVADIPSVMPPDPNGTGTLSLFRVSDGTIVQADFGTVNYGSGEIAIKSFIPVSFPAGITNFRITASIQEVSQNIEVLRNQILIIDDSISNVAIGTLAGLTVNATPIVT
jgi:hypothetical protein